MIGYQNRQTEQDLSQVKSEVQRLLDVINLCKTEEVKAEQRKNQFELEILDLKRQVQTQRDLANRSQAELASTRKELEEEVTKSRAHLQQVERLRALVESLDSTKEELVKRLQNTNHEKMSEEQDKAVLLGDVQTYKRELMLREQEIADLRRSIESLDASRDEL